MKDVPRIVTIRYRNHRGEISDRRISPWGFRFAATEWHSEEQWIIDAIDVDKNANRSFAMRDILIWDVSRHAPTEPAPTESAKEQAMLIVHPYTDTTKRIAELLWAYESDEPHYHCDRGPGHYPAITWDELWPLTAQPHEGDCVGLPATCVRCAVEEIINKARWLAERMPAPAEPTGATP